MVLKYRNRPRFVDGIKFSSGLEAERYAELKLLEAAGEIRDLILQPKFEVIPKQYSSASGKLKLAERACHYIGDFLYVDSDGRRIVEDTKGMKTADYIIKRKLMLRVHGIQVREIGK